ncbi:Cof-type HAD-IIB family hydrolase [Alteribacillus sp. JSM 102045]|uniref:Cof-type HAD-IIB family hydrolase n=1 Tax=Alteribacillus sp. JSM 102045 TaxID=1562101 RepID=UPI0035BFDC6B
MNVVAIDMDGTLLNSEGFISEKNAQALRALQAQGHKVIIATGRGLPDVNRLLGDVNITPDGVVSLNGARVFWEGEAIQESYMGQEESANLIEWLNENEYYFHIYTDKGLFSPSRSREFFMNDLEIYTQDKEGGEEMKEAIRRRADGHHRQANMKELSSPIMIVKQDLTVYKFLIVSMLEQKLETCRKAWGDKHNILITSSGRDNLEIMHPDTQKGKGLLHIVEHAGLNIGSTFAIGDNYNDLPLFNAAATSIAMGNAEVDVKRVATHETTHHDNDGVAQAIEKFILKSSART